MNTNTVQKLTGPGTGFGQVVALTLTSTTETQFVTGSNTSGTTSLAVLTVPSGVPSGSQLVGSGSPTEFNQNPAISSESYGRKTRVGTEAPYFSATTFDVGRPFKIRVTGNATLNAGSANTVVINLYQGTSTTIGSNSKVAALTAGGAPSTSFNFMLETVIQWDVTSQVLGGWYIGQCANTITAAHALSNASSVTTAAGLAFNITGTFGNAGGGTINISEFSVEQV